MKNYRADIGIIGGSGFYDLASSLKEIKSETPYGPPSDKIALGVIAGKRVAFLSRHNKSHDVPPHQINYRANIWALKSLGVKRIITSHAVGSLQPITAPISSPAYFCSQFSIAVTPNSTVAHIW